MIAAQGGKARTASSFKVDKHAHTDARGFQDLSSVDLLHAGESVEASKR